MRLPDNPNPQFFAWSETAFLVMGYALATALGAGWTLVVATLFVPNIAVAAAVVGGALGLALMHWLMWR